MAKAKTTGKKLKHILSNLSVFVVSIIIALFIGEVVVRVFSPQQLIVLNNEIWQPDSVFEWSHKPFTNVQINAGERKVRFISDQKGFRVNSIEEIKANPDSAISILAIGDSFVEAIQVENQNTMNEKLRKLLEKKHNREIYVANSAVGGWSPHQYYLLAKEELERKKYDLGIVYLYVGNDFINHFDTTLSARTPTITHKLKFPQKINSEELKENILYPINDFFERRSHLFILLKKSLKILLAKAGLTAYYFPPSLIKSDENLLRFQNTALICKKINEKFSAKNTPVAFILIPDEVQFNSSAFEEYVSMFDIDTTKIDLTYPNRYFSEEMKKNNLNLFDPLDLFSEKHKQGERLFGKIDNHLNEKGHEVMAEFLLQAVNGYLGSIDSVQKNN